MEHTFCILPDRKSKNALMRHNSVAGINFSGKSAVSKISYQVLSYFFNAFKLSDSLGMYILLFSFNVAYKVKFSTFRKIRKKFPYFKLIMNVQVTNLYIWGNLLWLLYRNQFWED